MSDALKQAAYELAEEIRYGEWNHMAELKRQPEPSNQEIIDELRRRCPGYTLEEYGRAIADGLFNSR